jgi:hypothetical protein
MVKALLQHGANVNALKNNGASALSVCIFTASYRPQELRAISLCIADLLLDAGALVRSKQTRKGCVPAIDSIAQCVRYITVIF